MKICISSNMNPKIKEIEIEAGDEIYVDSDGDVTIIPKINYFDAARVLNCCVSDFDMARNKKAVKKALAKTGLDFELSSAVSKINRVIAELRKKANATPKAQRTCPKCDGAGKVGAIEEKTGKASISECFACRGTGRIKL